MELTFSTIIIIIMLLATIVVLVVIFSQGMGLGEGSTTFLSEGANESVHGIDLNPAAIFCTAKRFSCGGTIYIHKGDEGTGLDPGFTQADDPWAACQNDCTARTDPPHCSKLDKEAADYEEQKLACVKCACIT